MGRAFIQATVPKLWAACWLSNRAAGLGVSDGRCGWNYLPAGALRLERRVYQSGPATVPGFCFAPIFVKGFVAKITMQPHLFQIRAHPLIMNSEFLCQRSRRFPGFQHGSDFGARGLDDWVASNPLRVFEFWAAFPHVISQPRGRALEIVKRGFNNTALDSDCRCNIFCSPAQPPRPVRNATLKL